MEYLYEECKPEAHVSGQLYQLKVADLCPTQSAVGFDEVKAKVESMRHKSKDSLIALLITRPVPIVIGPEGRFYLVDHHHLARAVWELIWDPALKPREKAKQIAARTGLEARAVYERLARRGDDE